MLSTAWWRHWGPTVVLWLLVMAGFYVAIDWLIQRQDMPNRISNLSGQVLQLQRARDGHYRLEGRINGQLVRLMIDTGASGVAMDSRLANKLGLPRGAAITISTANGMIEGNLTRLDELRLGDIVLRNIPASIAPNFGDPDEILLGMSALRHLEVSMRGDTLTISVPKKQ
ncbi:retropepsin-like aspartic protease family protein [Chitinimonas sp. BJB300]|uniref:retropepsin-like aspartic protease family protein n=1 Tax=Chitinimonas sp. BJB300 TaxID=1559339 RepID=UPI000C0E2364|nr:retropepsin-like aspartic protease [Chitinimonas sp. BJB300]PHV12154.1 TIGR02281 family clan AA aspartic protease [Chitinimonas sp. BJB300]TSJ90114.1 TIGR02281 family clan AA aspartic protease [Chitinimonas sp. BJB300]